MALIQPKKNEYLIKTLFGILYILPQGNAYEFLHNRLKHIGMMLKLDISKIIINENKNEINEYINIFESIHKNIQNLENQSENNDDINDI
ncbi:MAG: hypothetical protein II388_09305 [Clostridia bacterium]|nr:hypothetical protein [Clostridia bacterium]